LLLSGFLFFISRKYVKKDYPLQTYENVFLLLPCIAALCISVIIRLIISSLNNGMGIVIYETVPPIRFWLPVVGALMLSDMIASVILFQKQVQYHEETGKRALLENQVRQMQKEITEIQDIYSDMRGLRHDMRSHIANISLLVKNVAGSVNEELESYIGKMEETVSRLDFTYQTGNPITDIIIHQKGQEAEKKQIPFRVDFVYPCNLPIDAYDIAVILNNALENAIMIDDERKRLIHITVSEQKGFVFIKIANYCENPIEIKSGKMPETTKSDKKNHGFGLKSIRQSVEKYGGAVTAVMDQNWFELNLLFPKTVNQAD